MDGRVRRGELNRQAIADAALALMAETGTLPTAQAIAERAGLAKRSVFHHFPDMEAVLARAAATQAERYWQVLQLAASGQPLSSRIAAAVAQRARLFEGIGDVRRVAVLYESRSAPLAELLQESRSRLRRHLRRALSPEFLRLGRSAQEGVHAIASWEAWETLRRHQGVSADTARAAVQSMIESAFAQVQSLEV